MFEQNVEIVRCAYEALARALVSGDLSEPMERWWDPECVLRPAGLFPESAEVRGPEAVRGFLANQVDAFEAMRVEPLDFIDAGDSSRFGLAAERGTPGSTSTSRSCTS